MYREILPTFSKVVINYFFWIYLLLCVKLLEKQNILDLFIWRNKKKLKAHSIVKLELLIWLDVKDWVKIQKRFISSLSPFLCFEFRGGKFNEAVGYLFRISGSPIKIPYSRRTGTNWPTPQGMKLTHKKMKYHGHFLIGFTEVTCKNE